MNTPNKITLIRILLIPVMLFFYLASFVPFGKFIALAIFIIAATTDFLDGYLARKNNQITTLGKFLDPIADKLLVTAALLVVCLDGTIPYLWAVLTLVIILSREFIVSAFRQIAASKGSVIAADKWGKIKTLVTDIAIPVLMLASALKTLILNGTYVSSTLIEIVFYTGYALIGLAVLLTIISGVNYLVKNREVFKN